MICPHCGVDNDHISKADNEADPIGKFCRACRQNMRLPSIRRTSVVSTPTVTSIITGAEPVHAIIQGDMTLLMPSTPQTKAELMELLREKIRETNIKEICEILSVTIKRDYATTAITFLAAILNYTARHSVIVTFKAGSSTGKSYVPLQVLELFPKEDVIKLAGASPTSFFHELGTPVYEQIIDEEGKRHSRLKHILVDLANKIVVFLDQPNPQLLERLRSFCSKDTEYATFKITDRTSSGSQRTKTVILKGPATFFYCTARLTAEDQENTRTFILSPEVSQEKLREAIDLITIKETDHDFFQEGLDNDPKRKWLRERVLLIKSENIREINMTPEDSEYLRAEFLRRHPILIPRYSRDFPRLIALAKAHAVLNLWNRPTGEKDEKHDVIQVNRTDIETALELYDSISEANELGLPPILLDWLRKVVLPFWDKGEFPDRKQIAKKHFEIYHEPLPRHRFDRDYIPSLEGASLIATESDPEDKRRIIYTPVNPAATQDMCHSTVIHEEEVKVIRPEHKGELYHTPVEHISHTKTSDEPSAEGEEPPKPDLHGRVDGNR